MEQLEHEQWRGSTQGTTWMHRALIWWLGCVNLRLVYLCMAVFVVPCYMLLAHKGYITMYHYFRRRHHFGPCKSLRYVYLNHYRFGQVILDRFAFYAGGHFHFELDGYEEFDRLCHQPGGFMILSSHVGNYELAGYAFRASVKRYNALVYAGEAPTVMEQRNRVLSKNNIRMVPVSADMAHVFTLNEALTDGEIVSIPADRIFGSPRRVECVLLGAKVQLPLGPYAMALQRGVPTLAIFVMKESAYSYRCYIRRVEAAGGSRQERVQGLAQSFACEVEHILQRYPEQWFNYYEFWKDE